MRSCEWSLIDSVILLTVHEVNAYTVHDTQFVTSGLLKMTEKTLSNMCDSSRMTSLTLCHIPNPTIHHSISIHATCPTLSSGELLPQPLKGTHGPRTKRVLIDVSDYLCELINSFLTTIRPVIARWGDSPDTWTPLWCLVLIRLMPTDANLYCEVCQATEN